MASTDTAAAESLATEGYQLQGSLLEACDCNVLCPCWIGEDPDNSTCQSVVAYHLDQGTINGVDVSGLTLANVVFIPGNVLDGGWQAVTFVDDKASDEQVDALVAAFTGQLGGPLADLAQLIGEHRGVIRAPITHTVTEGAGTLDIGEGQVVASMEPYRGPDGSVTVLQNSIFSTVPGSPAWVGKASRFAVDLPEQGWTYEYSGRNAIQSNWTIDYRGDGS
jgi:hypothetical protein